MTRAAVLLRLTPYLWGASAGVLCLVAIIDLTTGRVGGEPVFAIIGLWFGLTLMVLSIITWRKHRHNAGRLVDANAPAALVMAQGRVDRVIKYGDPIVGLVMLGLGAWVLSEGGLPMLGLILIAGGLVGALSRPYSSAARRD